MKTVLLALAFALALVPPAAEGRGAGLGGAGFAGGGFDMHNDAPTRNAGGGYGGVYDKNTGTATTYNKSTNTSTTYKYNGNTSGGYNAYNSAGAYNKNTGNAAVYNKNTGNMTVYNRNTGTSSTYHYNNSGSNGYYYSGRVIVNPVYVGPAWGWNAGVAWAPVTGYWGGGFWGPFAAGAAMGYVIYQNQQHASYAIAATSPGARLLSNYGLRQEPCGPPGQVVIYGPNFGIICASPNNIIAAGSYAVNVNNLTLQSQ